jgi:methylaspartate ammonia-lyase
MQSSSRSIVDSNTESNSVTRSVTDEILSNIDSIPESTITSEDIMIVEPASLVELLEWKNANGVTLKKREDKSIWVTNDIEVPPSIAASFEIHHDTIVQLIPDMQDEVADLLAEMIEDTSIVINIDDDEKVAAFMAEAYTTSA